MWKFWRRWKKSSRSGKNSDKKTFETHDEHVPSFNNVRLERQISKTLENLVPVDEDEESVTLNKTPTIVVTQAEIIEEISQSTQDIEPELAQTSTSEAETFEEKKEISNSEPEKASPPVSPPEEPVETTESSQKPTVIEESPAEVENKKFENFKEFWGKNIQKAPSECPFCHNIVERAKNHSIYCIRKMDCDHGELHCPSEHGYWMPDNSYGQIVFQTHQQKCSVKDGMRNSIMISEYMSQLRAEAS